MCDTVDRQQPLRDCTQLLQGSLHGGFRERAPCRDVRQVTKAGRFYERGGQTWVFPTDRIPITRCNEPLPEEMQWKCASYRSQAEQFLEDVRNRGEIDHIVMQVQERRARSVY